MMVFFWQSRSLQFEKKKEQKEICSLRTQGRTGRLELLILPSANLSSRVTVEMVPNALLRTNTVSLDPDAAVATETARATMIVSGTEWLVVKDVEFAVEGEPGVLAGRVATLEARAVVAARQFAVSGADGFPCDWESASLTVDRWTQSGGHRRGWWWWLHRGCSGEGISKRHGRRGRGLLGL